VGGVNTQKTSLKATFDGMMASLTGKNWSKAKLVLSGFFFSFIQPRMQIFACRG
jgi:hypothetical protein